MTYTERNYILRSEDFIAQCRIALADWVEYWAVNGTSSIEDEELRSKTNNFIRSYLYNTEAYVYRVAALVIGNDILETAEEVTDEIVKRAVDIVMTKALDYLI